MQQVVIIHYTAQIPIIKELFNLGLMMPNSALYMDNTSFTSNSDTQHLHSQSTQIANVHTPEPRFTFYSQQSNVNPAAFDYYMGFHCQNIPQPFSPSKTPIMSPAQSSFAVAQPSKLPSDRNKPTSSAINQYIETVFPSSSSSAAGASTPIRPVSASSQRQNNDNKTSEVLIYERNNLRLSEMEKEIRDFVTYGPACDEFLVWLQDQRAYNKYNESALMRCATAVHEKAEEYGAWSGLRIINTIYSFRKNLSENAQAQVVQWRNEMMSGSFGKPASITTSMQQNVPSNAHQAQSTKTSASIPIPNYCAPTSQPQPTINYSTPVPHIGNPHHRAQAYISQNSGIPSVSISSQQSNVPTNSSQNTNNTTFIPSREQDAIATAGSQTEKSQANSSLVSLSRYNLSYKRKVDYALKPFRLQHKKMHTRTPFFIGPDVFRRIAKDDSIKIAMDASSLPILYVLTAWRVGQSSTKCEWPETIAIEINGKRPKISKIELRETEDIIKKTVMSRTLSIEVVQNLINKRLGKLRIGQKSEISKDDDEIEIHQQHFRMSLKCPISLLRIQQPVRGENCKHPDCFDLESYLVVNQDNIGWKCPHCNECTPPNKLCRDLFFEDLLVRVPKNANEVEFTGSCDNWKVTKCEIPDVDDGPDDEDGDAEAKTLLKSEDRNLPRINASPQLPNDTNVISLLSDDEDEEFDDAQLLNRKRRASSGAVRSDTSSVEKSPTTPSTKRRNGEAQYFDNSNLLMSSLFTIPRFPANKLDATGYDISAASVPNGSAKTPFSPTGS
ncbi:hypothetical protein EC973_006992 [Apophysomyces ossiformis]|uniref:SP-RING-type domain-containing protein n=1 Tax=Apophysomyces ossiformis TaxID=679940 RepID=A0A8H7BJI2_9FUNG|nr:hypothetical protein EC973_006992 [Apophysomyces ossiformis]